MRRFYISLIALAIIPLLLLLTAYAATPYMVQWGAAQWLTAQGFTGITLDIERPEWNELRVRQFTASKATDSADLLLETGSILIRFSPLKVWTTQKVDLIELPASHLSVRLKDNVDAQQPNKPEVYLDLASFLPAVWFAAVPADQVRVGELNITLDYPVGQPDWSLKGALLVESEQLYSRLRFYREGLDLGWGDLELAADNHFNLRLLQQDTPFIVIDGNLKAEDAVVLHANQLIDLQGLGHWLHRFMPDMDIPALSGSVSTQGTFSLPLQAALSPDTMLSQLVSEHRFKTQASLKGMSPVLSDVALNLGGTLRVSDKRVAATLNKGNTVTVVKPQLPDIRMKQALVTLKRPIAFNAEIGRDGIALTNLPISGSLTLSPIYQGKHRAVVSPVEFSVDSADLVQHQYKGTISIARLSLDVPDQRLPDISVKTDFDVDPQVLNTTFDLNTLELPLRIAGRSSTDLDRMSSAIQWTLKAVDITGFEKQLRTYFSAVPAELTLKSGRLLHNGEAKIRNAKMHVNYWNAINHADLTWNKTELNDVVWRSSGRYNENGWLNDRGTLKIARIFSGVEVNSLKTEYRITRHPSGEGKIKMAPVTAFLLGGDIQISEFETALAPLNVTTSVELQQLDMAEILKLEQQEGLSGEGRLNGQFPIVFDKDGLRISDGRLTADAPGGAIRFQPDGSVAAYAAANQGLAMALGALENFQYDTLEIKLNYAPDGTALLNTRLKGHNPDWNKGHPVDFTINVEENIPDLIRTLQFADELTEKLEKRYRD